MSENDIKGFIAALPAPEDATKWRFINWRKFFWWICIAWRMLKKQLLSL